MGTELIPLVFTSGWASGINAYAAVLVLGIADKMFALGQVPDALARTDVLIGAGILFAVEMLADKIPYLDSVWDSVHTIVRPAVGATIGYLIGHEGASIEAALTAATGGVTALLSHGIKAGLRAAVNTSPEPASNVVVSTVEDVAVTGVMSLALVHPWLAAGIALTLLVIGTWLVIVLARRIRLYKRRYDAWGERVGLAPPRASTTSGQGAGPTVPSSPSPPPRPRGQQQPFDQDEQPGR